MNWTNLQNPVLNRSDSLRDPAVIQREKEWHIYYTRFSNDDWYRKENWSVARIITRDWIHFEDDRDITPKGYASPGDLIQWHGRWILPYESYPIHPSGLFFSESPDCCTWSEPREFLAEVKQLPWNSYNRAIDPTLVVHGDSLYCFFTVSVRNPATDKRANAIGLARTQDPQMVDWEILSTDKPLLGPSEKYPDGVENLAIVPKEQDGAGWTMYYSAGLKNQRIARMDSRDLIHWSGSEPVPLEDQWWCSRVQGAPGLFRNEQGQNFMIIMGSDVDRKTRFGLAKEDSDGQWTMLPCRERDEVEKTVDLPF